MTDWSTYYWQGLQDAMHTALYGADGNALHPTLGMREGGVQTLADASGNAIGPIIGSAGTFYTCVRSQAIMETPAGLSPADPYIVRNLVGVWL